MTGSISADLASDPDDSDGAGPADSTAEEPRKRGRPRDPGADDRILQAAAELMLSVGYDSMTVDDVAAAAHVGKATVYRRFAKKEDLAVAAMRQLYGSEIPTPNTGSLRTDLHASLTSALQFAGSPTGAAYLRTAVAESSRDPQIAMLYREANAQAEVASIAMWERAVERGEMRADINITALNQMITGILLVRTVTRTPMPGLDEVDSLVDLVLTGIGC